MNEIGHRVLINQWMLVNVFVCFFVPLSLSNVYLYFVIVFVFVFCICICICICICTLYVSCFCFPEPESSCIKTQYHLTACTYLIFCFRCNCLLWQRQLKIVYIHSSQRLFSISWVTKFYTHQQASVSFLSFWIVPCESNVLDICTLLFQCPPSSLLETWNIEIKL